MIQGTLATSGIQRYKFFLVSILIFSFAGKGICADASSTSEIKMGYFIFSDAKLRDIYDRGGFDLQISSSYTVWEWLQIYGSVEYMQRRGRCRDSHQRTKIWETPLSLGLKSMITITQKVAYYFASGPRYFFVFQHNHSKYIDEKVFQSGLGGFANTGLNLFPLPHFVVDIFAEYSYGVLHFHPSGSYSYGRRIQVGGFCFGAWIGYAY